MAEFAALAWPTRALMRTANFDPEVNHGNVTPSESTYYLVGGALIWIVAILFALTLSIDIYMIARPEGSDSLRFVPIAGLMALLLPVTWTIERSLICSLPNVMSRANKTRALMLRGFITLGSATLSTLTLLVFANGPELDLRNQQSHLDRVQNGRDQVTKGTGLQAVSLALDQSQLEASRLAQLLSSDAPTSGLAALLQASNACRDGLAQLQRSLDPRIAAWKAERRSLSPSDSRSADLAEELAHASQRIASKRAQCQDLNKSYTAAKIEHDNDVKRSLERVNATASEQRGQQKLAMDTVNAEMAVLSSRSAAVAGPRLISRADALPGLLRDSLGVALISVCWFFVITGIELAAILHKLSKTTVHQLQTQQRDDVACTAALEETARCKAQQEATFDYWESQAGMDVAQQRVASREQEVQLTEKIQRRARVTGIAARAYVESLRGTGAEAFDDSEVRDAAAQLRRDLSELKAGTDRPSATASGR